MLQVRALDDDGRELKGQIAPPAGSVIPEDALVIVAEDGEKVEYPITGSGRFDIPRLPDPGTELAVFLDDRLIHIELPS